MECIVRAEDLFVHVFICRAAYLLYFVTGNSKMNDIKILKPRKKF